MSLVVVEQVTIMVHLIQKVMPMVVQVVVVKVLAHKHSLHSKQVV